MAFEDLSSLHLYFTLICSPCPPWASEVFSLLLTVILHPKAFAAWHRQTMSLGPRGVKDNLLTPYHHTSSFYPHFHSVSVGHTVQAHTGCENSVQLHRVPQAFGTHHVIAWVLPAGTMWIQLSFSVEGGTKVDMHWLGLLEHCKEPKQNSEP